MLILNTEGKKSEVQFTLRICEDVNVRVTGWAKLGKTLFSITEIHEYILSMCRMLERKYKHIKDENDISQDYFVADELDDLFVDINVSPSNYVIEYIQQNLDKVVHKHLYSITHTKDDEKRWILNRNAAILYCLCGYVHVDDMMRTYEQFFVKDILPKIEVFSDKERLMMPDVNTKLFWYKMERIKQIDKNGNERFNLRDVAKLLGYTRYSGHFKDRVIPKAIKTMLMNGIQVDDWLQVDLQPIINGNGRIQELETLVVNREICYYVAMNADTRKPNVALAQQYFVKNSLTLEEFEKNVVKKEWLFARETLKYFENKFNSHVLRVVKDVPDLAGIRSNGDYYLFGMLTSDIKEKYDIPNKNPLADYMDVALLSEKIAIIKNIIHEISLNDSMDYLEIKHMVRSHNKNLREYFKKQYGNAPEDHFINLPESSKD